MTEQKAHYSLSAISPENFTLILQRLTQPSAEEKMRIAFAKLEEDLASGKLIVEKARRAEQERILLKKKEKLERRIAKLVEFKKQAAAPLVISLFFAGLFWLFIFAAAGGATALGVSAALQQDIDGSNERLKTTFTVEEMKEGFSLGQYMGVAEGLTPSNIEAGKDESGEWREPAWYIEITALEYADDCDLRNELLVEQVDCKESARVDFVLQNQPQVSMTCVFTVPEASEPLVNSPSTFVNQESKAVDSFGFMIGKPESDREPATLMACQTYGTEDAELAELMAYTAGQTALRHNARTYIQGGVFSWYEADGTAAPRLKTGE